MSKDLLSMIAEEGVEYVDIRSLTREASCSTLQYVQIKSTKTSLQTVSCLMVPPSLVGNPSKNQT